jgi:hypothetical protein
MKLAKAHEPATAGKTSTGKVVAGVEAVAKLCGHSKELLDRNAS